MEAWLIYRMLHNLDGTLEKIQPLELCKTENEAMRFKKLFDLQTPMDLKDKITHSIHFTNYEEEEILP